MAELVGAINGTGNANRDAHFAAAASHALAQGVVSGLVVSETSVSAGVALVSVTRTSVSPSETFLVPFYLTAAKTISTGANKKIYVRLDTAKINDPAQITDPFGAGVGAVEVGTSWPVGNYVKLAETDGSGVVVTTSRETAKINILALDLSAIAQDFIPDTDNVRSLGTAGKRLKEVRAVNFHGSGASLTDLPLPVGAFGGTGADGDVTGALTIAGSNYSYIVKNYRNFAPGAVTIDSSTAGAIIHIKVSGNLDLTNTTLAFQGRGGIGGAGGAAGSAGNDGGVSAGGIRNTAPTKGNGSGNSNNFSGGGGGGGGCSPVSVSATAGSNGNGSSPGSGGAGGTSVSPLSGL